jgi:hypothetical protein
MANERVITLSTLSHTLTPRLFFPFSTVSRIHNFHPRITPSCIYLAIGVVNSSRLLPNTV